MALKLLFRQNSSVGKEFFKFYNYFISQYFNSISNKVITIMPPKRKAVSNQDLKEKKAKVKKTAPKSESESDEEVRPKLKRSKQTKSKASSSEPKGVPLNQTSTNYDKIDFTCTKKNALGETPNFRIVSWNVDGLRAWIKKNGLTFLEYEKPNVLCLQETKCSEDKLPKEITDLDYKKYWHNSKKDGYAGVALLSLTEPLSVKYGIDVVEHDDEGRCITAEFDKFFIVSVYVPNAGRNLVTLPKRLEWNKAFKKFIKDLDEKKPVIVCGDMNVAHEEIDLANPKTNTKNAGFTKEEREGMTEFLSDGYVDSFRKFYPDQTGAFTFWTYMRNARSKNVGWRLDYFIVSERFMDNICDNIIRNQIFGSDHCPLTLFLNI